MALWLLWLFVEVLTVPACMDRFFTEGAWSDLAANPTPLGENLTLPDLPSKPASHKSHRFGNYLRDIILCFISEGIAFMACDRRMTLLLLARSLNASCPPRCPWTCVPYLSFLIILSLELSRTVMLLLKLFARCSFAETILAASSKRF